MDLGEPEVAERGAEAGRAGRRDLERGAQPGMPQRGRRAVEYHRQCRGDRRPVQVERRCRGRAGQRSDHRLGELRSAGRLRAGGDRALDGDDGLLRQRRRGGGRGRAGQHGLGEPGAVPDDQEGHRLELALAVQPAGDLYVLADAGRQVGGHGSGDHPHSSGSWRPLGSAGEKGTRGATALSPRLALGGRAAASFRPGDGGRPAGHWAGRGGGRRSSPHSGGSSRRVREAAFSAAGGSLWLA